MHALMRVVIAEKNGARGSVMVDSNDVHSPEVQRWPRYYAYLRSAMASEEVKCVSEQSCTHYCSGHYRRDL